MIIKNAKYLDSQGKFQEGAISIRNGRIDDLNCNRKAGHTEKVIDASGFLILPGAVDPHVHFREPGQFYKEGIANGSMAALKGGVTTILDMPNNKPPCSTENRLRRKKEMFREKCLINWGLQFHATRNQRGGAADKSASAKIFMAKSSEHPAVTSVETLKQIFSRFPVVSIHAEDETKFNAGVGKKYVHHINRPWTAITSALQKIEKAYLALPQKKRPRVVICHLNTADDVDWIAAMKDKGFDVWGETCPHYLFFTQNDYIRNGAKYQVNPPLRTSEDQQHILEGLKKGIIDFIGTDHAPHSLAEKSSLNPPSGIAGIEWLMPFMFHLLDMGVIDWKRFHEIICRKAADCYSIKDRDGIKIGNFADLVFVSEAKGNPAEYENPAKAERIITRAGFNPYYGHIDFKWKVQTTIVNGVIKYDGKKFYKTEKGMEV